MDSSEVKMKCLEIAAQQHPLCSADRIIEEAQKLYEWIADLKKAE